MSSAFRNVHLVSTEDDDLYKGYDDFQIDVS